MIEYKTFYTSGVRPYLAKTLSSGSEAFETKLNPMMSTEELALIPLSSIYAHLDNISLHIQERASTLSTVHLDDENVDFSSPFYGYREIELSYEEALEWFQYIFKTREPEELIDGTPA